MSTFVWIDHSEKQRRQMLEAMDLFREKDTRDELGIAGIRDAFSDMLFPGTGALQTRARYFFFVPWMYLGFEAARIPSSEVARRARAFEITLIDKLVEASDPVGTIGRLARSSLQRVPSNIYWNGLKILGIRLFDGSQAEYHRTMGRRTVAANAVQRNDDGEVVGGVDRAWHAGLPAAPGTFPSAADFALTHLEAGYLKSRLLENHRSSLFAFMLVNGYEHADVQLAWEHPATMRELPVDLRRVIEHARCFSEVMHGASILYNLYLAELEPRRDAVIADCKLILDEWLALVGKRRHALLDWDREDLWKLLAENFHVPTMSTRLFVETWCRAVIGSDPATLRALDSTRQLIFDREAHVKGSLARCSSRRAREMWNGEAGMQQLAYRWRNAGVILRDISAGLAGGNA